MLHTYETCLARDNSRNRNVGESVIRRMLLNFQPPYYDEGWDDIEFRLNDEPYRRSDYDNWLDCEHDNPHHNNTVKEHTLRVMTEAAKLQQGRRQGKGVAITLIVAASLHDIGKKFVKAFKNSRGEPSEIAHFYNHHNVGSYFASDYLCEYSEEEKAQYHTIIVFDAEYDKKRYEKINGKVLLSEDD